jgi:hypothetical protein
MFRGGRKGCGCSGGSNYFPSAAQVMAKYSGKGFFDLPKQSDYQHRGIFKQG